jgi:glycosyltransferase involved in cell wall biosynthesis
MKISLIISTYNRPGALRLCLMSVLRQTRMPDNVIVADDGSGQETSDLINKFMPLFKGRLHHAWHEDKGFRLAAIRNKAVRDYCSEGYLIFIDGDIILERHFVADHEKMAKPNHFVIGSRAKLDKLITRYMIMKRTITTGTFRKGVGRRINTLHLPYIYFLTKYMYFYRRFYGRGANMAMYYDDYKRTNGFDEDIIGYGYEDFDIFNRLLNIGVRRHYAKFRAIEYHLDHKKVDKETTNSHLVYGNLSRKKCEKGLINLTSGEC